MKTKMGGFVFTHLHGSDMQTAGWPSCRWFN